MQKESSFNFSIVERKGRKDQIQQRKLLHFTKERDPNRIPVVIRPLRWGKTKLGYFRVRVNPTIDIQPDQNNLSLLQSNQKEVDEEDILISQNQRQFEWKGFSLLKNYRSN